MTNTAAFLAAVDTKTKNMILENIAKHYGITTTEAYEEVTDTEAEHLLDYVTGPERMATGALMQKHGFR